ncbi:hypothetical protein GGR51DRAFT_560918 [Nemania sp. FL0031]|nr:hypothetical protein GGR51DRAFT_560918 [Nemania sp. FL0031]
MMLVTIARSLWGRPRDEQPNVNVPLLQLPVDLIVDIAKFLAPADKVLLSQTCSSMRDCLAKHSNANAAHLSRADYFAYLAGIARGLPEKWVCDCCMALHTIDKYDKPTAKWRSSRCPVYSTRPLWRHSRLHDTHHIRIQHHHVQLALKYTRLQQRKYDSYLRDLLAPYQRIPFDTSSRRYITHRDFGSEGSPLDLAWRSQNIYPGVDGIENTATAGPTLHHKAGSIKDLYGPAPEILPVPERKTAWHCYIRQEVHGEAGGTGGAGEAGT